MGNKKHFRAAFALATIMALVGAYASILADEPLHLLKPDPECAICQAKSGLAITSSDQIIPNLYPQIVYEINLILFAQHFPALIHSLSIRAPPFIPSMA